MKCDVMLFTTGTLSLAYGSKQKLS